MQQFSETTRLDQIATVWAQTLGVEAVGPDDNFFSLGGDSIMVTVMVLQVEELFDTVISADLVFDHPTLRQFVAAIAPAEQVQV